jgi:acyl-CoA thioesterase FadM
MYPFPRLAKELFRHRNAAPLAVGDTHVTTLTCWPWDIDLWMELNNGRTLTVMDLGRVVMFRRMGFVEAMQKNRWGGTIAGASIRYRRRVRMLETMELRSRIVGWDDRFSYAEQSIWIGEACASHALLRMAVTSKSGIVPTAELARALDMPKVSPPLPDWITAWIAADAQRPWPPMAVDA